MTEYPSFSVQLYLIDYYYMNCKGILQKDCILPCSWANGPIRKFCRTKKNKLPKLKQDNKKKSVKVMPKQIMIFHSKAKKCALPFTESAMKDLSNFSSFDVEYEGHIYPTVEHAYQALKYSCTQNKNLVSIIRDEFANKTAVQAKSSGSKKEMKKRGVTLDVKCWNEISLTIMKKLILSKLQRHPEIRKILDIARDQNIRLVHFSRMDMYWGAHTNGVEVTGVNHLGEIYMDLM
jgi:ribA/ribD-fused uncharacterized protein